MKRQHAAQVQHKFEPETVLYLIGDINYSTVYLLNGQAILTSRTLKWYGERWPQFVRIHKATLINPHYVHSLVVISSIEAHLIMTNGARLGIGRRRINEVFEQLGFNRSEYAAQTRHVLNEA